jgi:molybdopterin-binding protein
LTELQRTPTLSNHQAEINDRAGRPTQDRGWRSAAVSIVNLHREEAFMKLSARNQLKGVVSEVRKNALTTIVKIEVRNPAVVSASITNEAAEELGLKSGQDVVAIIKASEVIVATP